VEHISLIHSSIDLDMEFCETKKNGSEKSNLHVKWHIRDVQCTYNVTSRRVRATIVTMEKWTIITDSECIFVALDIQHVKRMHHIVICGLPSSIIFFHIILQTTRFSIKKKKFLSLKYVFWFSLQSLSETSLIVRRIEQDVVKNYYIFPHVKCLYNILMKLKFYRQIFEKFWNIKLKKIRSLRTQFHVERRTDVGTGGHDGAISRFSQFCEHT